MLWKRFRFVKCWIVKVLSPLTTNLLGKDYERAKAKFSRNKMESRRQNNMFTSSFKLAQHANFWSVFVQFNNSQINCSELFASIAFILQRNLKKICSQESFASVVAVEKSEFLCHKIIFYQLLRNQSLFKALCNIWTVPKLLFKSLSIPTRFHARFNKIFWMTFVDYFVQDIERNYPAIILLAFCQKSSNKTTKSWNLISCLIPLRLKNVSLIQLNQSSYRLKVITFSSPELLLRSVCCQWAKKRNLNWFRTHSLCVIELESSFDASL